MGRKPKYSFEQKVKACEDYLETVNNSKENLKENAILINKYRCYEERKIILSTNYSIAIFIIS